MMLIDSPEYSAGVDTWRLFLDRLTAQARTAPDPDLDAEIQRAQRVISWLEEAEQEDARQAA
jgi:hypothetical protein